MITTYQLELSARLMPSDGYKLYAWLLTQIPSAAAEALHSQQDHPISQFVTFDKEKDTSIWNIHLLSTEASALFAPAIESIETISLHTGEISVVSKLPKTEIQFEDIIRQARQIASSCTEIQFRSAASFKQNGRYVIFPQEFVGKVTLDSRLPVPLAELWRAILLWADYSGIGIKTALGMGGANVRFL